MKKNRFSIVAFIFLSMSMVNSLEAKTLQDVASEMGLKKREAIKVLNGVNLIIQTVKSKFHDIADSDVSYYQKTGKRGLINETYPLFKRGKNTKIQTSSLNHRGIHSRYLGNYLRDLANISAQNGIDVHLHFGKDMQVRGIKHYGNTIVVYVDVLQFFKRCTKRNDRHSCYQDITTKTFSLNIKKSRGKYHYIVNSLRVKDTKKVTSTALHNMGIRG